MALRRKNAMKAKKITAVFLTVLTAFMSLLCFAYAEGEDMTVEIDYSLQEKLDDDIPVYPEDGTAEAGSPEDGTVKVGASLYERLSNAGEGEIIDSVYVNFVSDYVTKEVANVNPYDDDSIADFFSNVRSYYASFNDEAVKSLPDGVDVVSGEPYYEATVVVNATKEAIIAMMGMPELIESLELDDGLPHLEAGDYLYDVIHEHRKSLEAGETVSGDINLDGKVTASDARLALRASARLEDLNAVQIDVGDMDNNSKITAADARMILRVSAKLDSVPSIPSQSDKGA